jgi:hypothetical protein
MDTRPGSGYAASWTTEGVSGETTVTEAEWLTCTDPRPMLSFARNKASDRKLRLFGVASCREVWDLIVAMEEAGIGYGCLAVRLGEQLADDQATPEAVLVAIEDRVGLMDSGYSPDGHLLVSALPGLADTDALRGITQTAAATGIARGRQVRNQRGAARGEGSQPSEESQSEERAATVFAWTRQADLLRCIFGNPFRPVTISPAVLTWNDGLVTQLAQAAYDNPNLPEGTLDNGRLAVLADALEEAGCTDADILGHLRGIGPHVRGCWSVDLVLGKS